MKDGLETGIFCDSPYGNVLMKRCLVYTEEELERVPPDEDGFTGKVG